MKRQLVTMALAASALAPMAAQDQVEAPSQPAPKMMMPNSNNQVPLKVQFTLSRFKGEQKISSTPYMLGVLSNGQKTSLRVGTQVPVVMTTFGAKSVENTPVQSYSYRDVGTNIDCAAQSAGSGLFSLTVTVEDSSVHLDPSAKDQKQFLRDVPVFRSFRSSFAMVLRDGQSMQYASATDPISGEVMRIDVTLSLAK